MKNPSLTHCPRPSCTTTKRGLAWRQMLCALPLVLGASFSMAADDGTTMAGRVEQAMNAEHRSAAKRARNVHRHPVGTLDFFGLKDGMTVMEIWPGGGWYSEILAPALRGQGQFIVASYDPEVPDQPGYRYDLHKRLSDKLAATPDLYDQVKMVTYSPPQSNNLGAAGSVDMILTFRNMHGWHNDGLLDGVLNDFFRTLKPGGVLGVVQHRADTGANASETSRMGYLPEQFVIDMAKKAGFVLEARAEVNANAKDDHDHPSGVWTLPPSYRLGDENRDEYTAIGESDRMTLRFRKPS